MHVCPMVKPGGVPHVGGPIMPPGEPTVLIGGMPAARVGDIGHLPQSTRHHFGRLIHCFFRWYAGSKNGRVPPMAAHRGRITNRPDRIK